MGGIIFMDEVYSLIEKHQTEPGHDRHGSRQPIAG